MASRCSPLPLTPPRARGRGCPGCGRRVGGRHPSSPVQAGEPPLPAHATLRHRRGVPRAGVQRAVLRHARVSARGSACVPSCQPGLLATSRELRRCWRVT
jgi:hypothetical protein